MNEDIKKIGTNHICRDFQEQVSEVLIRHRSILDIMTKLDEYNARINRAVAKSVASCGCISICGEKQDYGQKSLEEMLDTVKSHVNGQICESCKDVLYEEIGSYIFYLAALSNSLDLDLEEILTREHDTIKTLGVFSLK